jgi:hypothetical protein
LQLDVRQAGGDLKVVHLIDSPDSEINQLQAQYHFGVAPGLA